MQFQVPQFIEVEDKIFGPLTFKQFVYVGGGLGIAYVLWRTLPIFLAAPLGLAFAGLGIALAFVQYNSQPFIVAVEHAFFYLIHGKLYLWNNEQAVARAKKTNQEAVVSAQAPYVPRLSDSKLHELSWSLDINERISSGIASGEDRAKTSPTDSIVAPVRTARNALPQ